MHAGRKKKERRGVPSELAERPTVEVTPYTTAKGAEGWIIQRDKHVTKVVTSVSSAQALDDATAKYAAALSRLAKK